MHCREFRRKHDAYVDDTLSGIELDAMARHRELCARCARLDTRVRRALLVAHNLPTIQPSAGFGDRLQLRLTRERALRVDGGIAGDARARGRAYPFTRGTYAAAAAGLLAMAGMAATLLAAGRQDRAIRLAPVVASLPEPEPSTLATPALVAAMPAGLGVWPAVFVAQQTPWYFASEASSR
jgi:hypothetical protein